MIPQTFLLPQKYYKRKYKIEKINKPIRFFSILYHKNNFKKIFKKVTCLNSLNIIYVSNIVTRDLRNMH